MVELIVQVLIPHTILPVLPHTFKRLKLTIDHSSEKIAS